ncbi:alpha-1,3/1,6-mannosyltransferase ALG2-like [Styela clava]
MLQIVFLHPDLGIGGAERLVVDAALALKSKGHRVSFLTSHHDKSHCFEETKDGTFSITVVGDWIPRHVGGRFHAAFAYLRMIFTAFYLALISNLKPDVIFCDQISACIPILKYGTGAKILFYCHFPDQLLTKRQSFFKQIYRAPLDWLEEKTTGMADLVLVNSHFTAKVFKDTFTSLKSLETHILYPSLNTEVFDDAKQTYGKYHIKRDAFPSDATCIFLSINRFERKKNLSLAIYAMAELKKLLSDAEWNSVHLAMAGGYDENLAENVEHFHELQDLLGKLDLSGKVSFFKSVSSTAKMALFKSASAVIYTPSNEHFGIVPLESMYMEKPVIAMKSGGPLETVDNEKTGFLCDENPISVAEAMVKFIRYPDLAKEMGSAGKQRVKTHFSFTSFANTLNGMILSIV